MLRSGVFPLASPLPSTTSLASGPASFGGFASTMELSDFPCPCIIGVRPWTFRCGLHFPLAQTNNGISRLPHKVLARMLRVSDRAGSIGVSRLRRLQSRLRLSSTASAPRSSRRLRDGGSISRLNTWPARTPVNASLVPLRTTKMHDSGSAWVASPSLHETFIHNTLPALTGALNIERYILPHAIHTLFMFTNSRM